MEEPAKRLDSWTTVSSIEVEKSSTDWVLAQICAHWPSAAGIPLRFSRAKDQSGMIFISWLLQKACDWLPVCAVVAAPSDSGGAVNICRCSESPPPCCPTLISLPPQLGHAAASEQTQLRGAQEDLWTSVHVVRLQLQLNRPTLRAPIRLNLGRVGSLYTR